MITAVIAGHWILLKFIVDFDFDYIKRPKWVELFSGFGEVMKIVNYCLLLEVTIDWARDWEREWSNPTIEEEMNQDEE